MDYEDDDDDDDGDDYDYDCDGDEDDDDESRSFWIGDPFSLQTKDVFHLRLLFLRTPFSSLLVQTVTLAPSKGKIKSDCGVVLAEFKLLL